MTVIEVKSTDEAPEIIPIDYESASHRYRIEAEDESLTPLEKQAKLDIADYAAKRAFEERVQSYLGNRTPHHLGNSAINHPK